MLKAAWPACRPRPAERKDDAVAKHYTRYAAGERDAGVRKVSRLTWRAGLIGIALSALFGGALAHAASSGQRTGDTVRQQRQPSGIIIPAQPPQQSSGASQVTSGAS